MPLAFTLFFRFHALIVSFICIIAAIKASNRHLNCSFYLCVSHTISLERGGLSTPTKFHQIFGKTNMPLEYANGHHTHYNILARQFSVRRRIYQNIQRNDVSPSYFLYKVISFIRAILWLQLNGRISFIYMSRS